MSERSFTLYILENSHSPFEKNNNNSSEKAKQLFPLLGLDRYQHLGDGTYWDVKERLPKRYSKINRQISFIDNSKYMTVQAFNEGYVIGSVDLALNTCYSTKFQKRLCQNFPKGLIISIIWNDQSGGFGFTILKDSKHLRSWGDMSSWYFDDVYEEGDLLLEEKNIIEKLNVKPSEIVSEPYEDDEDYDGPRKMTIGGSTYYMECAGQYCGDLRVSLMNMCFSSKFYDELAGEEASYFLKGSMLGGVFRKIKRNIQS